MLQSAVDHPEISIVATLSRQLGWSLFSELLSIAELGRRDFYAVFAAHEH